MLVALIGLLILGSVQAMREDDVSSFFLKAPKSVPRAGRSAPDGFFVKVSKHIPRVGRRDGNSFPSENANQDGNYVYRYGSENYSPEEGPYESESNKNVYGLDDSRMPHRNRRYNTEQNTLSYSANEKDEVFDKPDRMYFQTKR